MILMSLDLSTKSTGVAILDEQQLIYYECISASSTNLFNRIRKIVIRLKEIVEQYNPTNVIAEEVLPADVKHNQNTYKALIYLQAVTALMLDCYKLKIDFYVSSQWRKLIGIHTGRGVKRETLKSASIQLVKDQYNIQVNDDIADAICIGLAYINQNGCAFK